MKSRPADDARHSSIVTPFAEWWPLLFAQIYLCLITCDSACFSLPVDAAGRPAHQWLADMTDFSLVTIATVGYGDVLPVINTARMLAMFQAVVGQFYVAVVVALFVGMYSEKSRG